MHIGVQNVAQWLKNGTINHSRETKRESQSLYRALRSAIFVIIINAGALEKVTVMSEYVPSSNRAYYYRALKNCVITDHCQSCGAQLTGAYTRLQIHHKDEDIKNNEPDNLVCLCVPCHALAHGNLHNFIKSNPRSQ